MTTPTERPDRNRIYNYMTKSRFLNVEDALDIGKIRFFAGEYSAGQGMKNNTFHFLDVEDARVILQTLSWGKPITYTDYKGSNNGETISRVMTIKSNEDKIWFELKTGAGKATNTGAITPAGEAKIAVSVALDVYQAQRLALTVLAYIQAQDVVSILRP